MRRLDWVVDRWAVPLDFVMGSDAAWLDNGWLAAPAIFAAMLVQILWLDLLFFALIAAVILDWVRPL